MGIVYAWPGLFNEVPRVPRELCAREVLFEFGTMVDFFEMRMVQIRR